jgi:hypothetical protein
VWVITCFPLNGFSGPLMVHMKGFSEWDL